MMGCFKVRNTGGEMFELEPDAYGGMAAQLYDVISTQHGFGGLWCMNIFRPTSGLF